MTETTDSRSIPAETRPSRTLKGRHLQLMGDFCKHQNRRPADTGYPTHVFSAAAECAVGCSRLCTRGREDRDDSLNPGYESEAIHRIRQRLATRRFANSQQKR